MWQNGRNSVLGVLFLLKLEEVCFSCPKIALLEGLETEPRAKLGGFCVCLCIFVCFSPSLTPKTLVGSHLGVRHPGGGCPARQAYPIPPTSFVFIHSIRFSAARRCWTVGRLNEFLVFRRSKNGQNNWTDLGKIK